MFFANTNVIGITLKYDALICVEYSRMDTSVIKLVSELPINGYNGSLGTGYIVPPSPIEASSFIK